MTLEKNLEIDNVFSQIRSIYKENLFSEKNVLVTGASRGIGRAIALAFSALGAKVIINYNGSETAAQSTVEAIKLCGAQAACIKFDVSNFAAVQETIKNLEKDYGPINILVNNAGISKDNLFVRLKEEEWDSTLNINLKGAMNCARALAMSMIKQKSGKMIFISSVIGLLGGPGQAAYAASKAGLLGLTKSLALELASRNIQVNAIAPGYISTDMTEALGQDLVDKVMERIPLAKLGVALDIAKAAVFLASPSANYITGQTLAIDGGMTMR